MTVKEQLQAVKDLAYNGCVKNPIWDDVYNYTKGVEQLATRIGIQELPEDFVQYIIARFDIGYNNVQIGTEGDDND